MIARIDAVVVVRRPRSAAARTARRCSALAVVWLALAAPAASGIEPGEELIAAERGHTVRLPVRAPSDERIAQLRLPSGFRVAKFAADLGKPRMLRVGDDGTVYASRPDEGDVLALRDEDGDGRAERRATAVRGLADVHDVAIRGDELFLVTVESVYRTRLGEGERARLDKILDGLPPGGRHPNRTIDFGPDGSLYVSVGSTCNACVEPHREAAAIVRFAPDGSGRTRFASGLRNTIGFDWHPASGAMWGMDHNTDWLGDDFPPEELNLLQDGKHYGWPFVHGDGRQPAPVRHPEGFDAKADLARSVSPVLGYTAHAAPMQLAFYDATGFPPEYRNDAFVAMHGSWNRKPPAGFEVVRIDFDGDRPVAIEPFLSGFVIEGGEAAFGRPTGVAVAKDGALLVGDDANGVIYRVWYAP